MSWGDGYTSEWMVYEVNPDTWADGRMVGGLRSFDVTSQDSGLVQSGSIVLDQTDEIREAYYRIVLYSDQSGARERYDVATLHCVSGAREVREGAGEVTMDGRSVLYPASVNRLEHGSYAPSGVDMPGYAADMLRAVLKAPVVAEGSFTLDEPVVFDLGSTVLDSVRALLSYGGGTIGIEGDGTVHVGLLGREPVLSIDDGSSRLIVPGVRDDTDLGSVPNRYVADDGRQVAVAVNDDPASPVSHAARGYWSDVYDKSPVRVNGETLDSYAMRRLRECSMVRKSLSYSREYWPGVMTGSVIRATIPSAGLDGEMTVQRQRLSSGPGLLVEETAVMEVSAW